MGFRSGKVLWTVVGVGLLLGAAPLMFLAPHGTIAAGSAVAGVMGLCLALEGRRARGWKTVPGRITSSEVTEHTSATDSTSNVRAEIRYAYEVDGRSYSGDRIGAAAPSSESPGLARRRQSRYPPGATVQVYYLPEDPKTSLLEPGIPAVAWLLMGGWIFAGVAVAFWIERHGADPGKGWLDGIPPLLALAIPALGRITRAK